MTIIPPKINLSEPLPGALFETTKARFSSYRSFAVFSWPWLLRRTGWAFFWFTVLTIILVLTMRKDKPETTAMLSIIGLVNIKLFLLFCSGTIAAFFARCRYANTHLEKPRTLAALGLGMVAAVLIMLLAVDTPRDRISMEIFRNSPVNADIAAKQKVSYAEQGRYVDLATNIVVVLLFGGGLAGLSYVREKRRWDDLLREQTQQQAMQKLEGEKLSVAAKLAVLQAQVEPHFLFNSLASVRALVKQNPDKAQASIDALVVFLRATIPQMRADQSAQVVSTVAQQVELARAYLNVMVHRMGDRLRVQINVPDALANIPLPPMLLISLVENAIKHGAEPNLRATTICISANLTADDKLCMRVADDGAGLKPQATSGIGLANVRAQLAVLFAETAVLNLRQGGDENGTVAEIIIPITATEP